MFILRLVTLLVFLILPRASATPSCPSKEDFDVISKTVSDNFYDKTFKGLNWAERVSFYRQQVSCLAKENEVALIMNSLLAELKTSHTGLYTKDDLKYWSLKSIFSGDLKKFKIPFSGIWPIILEQHIYAGFIIEGSAASRVGLKKGDQLISINGNRFEPLGFPKGSKSILSYLPKDGKKTEVTIIPGTKSMQAHFLSASKKSTRIIPFNGKRIGYFHLWCGTHSAFLNALNESLRTFITKKIDGLIIDLRDGFGGANPEYLSLLTNDPVLKRITKTFIINGGVTSGKEWLAAIIKRDGIGRLVGTKTAGAFIAGAPFDLLNGRFLLYLAVEEFNPPDIPKLEGVGVEPDIEVLPCLRFCNGSDPQLEEALEGMFNK